MCGPERGAQFNLTMSAQLKRTQPSQPPGAASRKMVGFEEAMRITDEVAPFSVVSVLRLDGSLPVATLRAALDALQQRHPLLRARIVGEGKGHAYQFDVVGPIPLETVERSHRDSGSPRPKRNWHRRLDYAVGPLMRCRYLVRQERRRRDPHHPAQHPGCGMCGAAVERTPCPVRGPDARGRGHADEGQVAPPSLYPPEYTGLRFARAVAANMAHQMADEMKFRWNSRGVRKAPILPIDQGRCRILPIRIAAPLTASLVQASSSRIG